MGAETGTADTGRTKAQVPPSMEAVVERGNMRLAYQRVVENKGAPGSDGLGVDELKDWLKRSWPTVRAALLAGSYLPQSVRAVEIPKPSGGMRLLCIPTVVDRLIQQALLQRMQPIFEPHFSESSYGFRPGRSASQAVKAAQRYVQAGKRWVVDIDLEKFFDRVNHDILMSRVARRIKDERVLKLIRRYLEVGTMREGLAEVREQGTPQGGPLSPLLSNLLLDDLDRELEGRGHRFCRYADDCNIYVASKAAAKHAMAEITRFLEKKLKLKVNGDKSACARPWERKFLGYSLTWHRQAKLKIAPASLVRLRQRVREYVRVGRGRALVGTIQKLNPLLRGWMSYFRWTEVKGVLEELDGWIRRKLRAVIWRQGKRSLTRARALMRRGLDEERAWRSALNQRGAWWNAGASHMNSAYPKAYFDRLDLVSLVDSHRRWQASS
jgi:RNA-directed DNA polymerase